MHINLYPTEDPINLTWRLLQGLQLPFARATGNKYENMSQRGNSKYHKPCVFLAKGRKKEKEKKLVALNQYF